MLEINNKYHKNNWKVVVTEKGSVWLDKVYEKIFIGSFTHDIYNNRDTLLIELCERLDKKNLKYIEKHIIDILSGDNYDELR